MSSRRPPTNKPASTPALPKVAAPAAPQAVDAKMRPIKSLVTITGDGEIAAVGLNSAASILKMLGYVNRFSAELLQVLEVAEPGQSNGDEPAQ
jgi:hypothetical protein